jgi:hypothetical protein
MSPKPAEAPAEPRETWENSAHKRDRKVTLQRFSRHSQNGCDRLQNLTKYRFRLYPEGFGNGGKEELAMDAPVGDGGSGSKEDHRPISRTLSEN